MGAGDQVAHQAYTCLAVPEAVLATGAKPVFVDIEPGGVNMSPVDLEAKVTGEVRAIVVQHTFGIPAQMDAILQVAMDRGLPVIEDCCHSFSSTLHQKRVGTFGAGAFYSFEWGKPVVSGIGGAVVCNDPELRDELDAFASGLKAPPLARVARVEIQYAAFRMLYRPWTYWWVKRAFNLLSRSGVAEGNYHFGDEVSDEFGWSMSSHHRRRIRDIDADIAMHERANARLAPVYRVAVENSPHARSILEPEGSNVVFSRFPFWEEDKEALLANARTRGLELADWYKTPIHPLADDAEADLGYRRGSCPNAERAARHIVSLPVHSGVSDRFSEAAARLIR